MREALNFIAGEWTEGEKSVELLDKFDSTPIAMIHHASRPQVEAAIAALDRGFEETSWPAYQRYQVLLRASELLRERSDQFVDTVVADAGFTVSDAERETARAAETLMLCAEEAKRIIGEMVPLEGAPGATGRIAFTTRHPLGIVCAITPFNSPLNTVCHKVGPALASGNAVILKPAALTPLSGNLLIETLLDAGVPPALMGLVHGGGSVVGQWLLEDPRPAFYAFTGSTPVGLNIRQTIGLRRSQLELGSLSSTILCEDADIARAVPLCVNASFRKAGQVCTSIQRLYVHEDVEAEFVDALVGELKNRTYGDPRAPGAFVGPVISESEAKRIESWISDAVNAGAEALIGGSRDRSVVAPTVLANVTPEMRVMREEIFGPVVLVRRFTDLDAAIREANDTPYGLSAGIFTSNIGRGLAAAAGLRMGSVHINETSSSRVDLMPYGGVKGSGLGHEGPRYAIREMTEERLVSIGG